MLISEETVWLDCACRDKGHAVRITEYSRDGVGNVAIEVDMAHAPTLWRRVVIAWKYLFGRCTGEVERCTIILQPEDAVKLQRVVYWLQDVHHEQKEQASRRRLSGRKAARVDRNL